MKAINKKIVLYNDGGEYIDSYKTLWDAYRGLKEIKRTNKEYGFSEKYYFQYEIETDKEVFCRDIKIYIRKNKIYYKFI